MRRLTLLVAILALVVAACGPSDTGTQDWRGLTLDLPEGWIVFERSPTLLSVANAPLGEEAGDPGDRVVAAQFTYDPGTTPDDWRDFVEEQDGELEADTAVTLDEVPARKLVFSYTTGGTPTREMVVVVPSRGVVVLMQPVPFKGQRDAPQIFLDHLEQFEAILTSIRFGAPVEEAA